MKKKSEKKNRNGKKITTDDGIDVYAFNAIAGCASVARASGARFSRLVLVRSSANLESSMRTKPPTNTTANTTVIFERTLPARDPNSVSPTPAPNYCWKRPLSPCSARSPHSPCPT